jgi:hypothetical protein
MNEAQKRDQEIIDNSFLNSGAIHSIIMLYQRGWTEDELARHFYVSEREILLVLLFKIC